jgi:hypothetical protein
MLLGASRLTLASRQHPHDRQHAAVGILLGTSRLTRLLLASRQHPHDRQHGILLGISRLTLAVRRTEGGRREAHLLAARVVSKPALP